MNFKSLFVAATVAIGSLTVGSAALAKTTRCWYGHANTQLTHTFCDVTRRVNANGHIVFDVANLGTIVLWDDNTAELIGNDGSYTNNFITETSGRDVRLVNLDNDYNFVFRY